MKGKMNKLINKLSDEKFKHGSADCFTFTNALVKEWHGKDFRKLHPYKSKSSALRYIEAHGGIEALTTGTLGYSIAPTACVDGDVVSASVGSGIALGFVKIELAKCRLGWSIK